jgi:hypothetical protein
MKVGYGHKNTKFTNMPLEKFRIIFSILLQRVHIPLCFKHKLADRTDQAWISGETDVETARVITATGEIFQQQPLFQLNLCFSCSISACAWN